MNTLFALAGWVAVLWLIDWAFNTVSQTELGYAMIGLWLGWMPIIIWGISEDADMYREWKRKR